MFYCTGYSEDYNTYLIYDTEDGGTEKVSRYNLLMYMNKGIVIENLTADTKKPVLRDNAFIDNLLGVFKKKGNNLLTKVIVLQKDEQFCMQKLTELAISLGLIYKTEKLKVDSKKSLVIFPWQHYIYNFKNSDCNSFSEEKIERIDVCNPKVVELSKLGFDAFNFMILNIGTKQNPNWVNLSTCFNELKQYDSYFREDFISYIGITPNNRMFKVYMSRFEIYSVQFCTVKELKAKFDKIADLGTTDTELWNYMRRKRDFGKDDDIAVCKVSKKQYRKTVKELKVKYSTLQDVFYK